MRFAILETYHSSSSKVLRRLRLLLPFLLGRRRCLSSRREAKETVSQLDNYDQRSKLDQCVDRILYESVEAQDKAREQDGSMDIGCQERIVIVEDLNWFRLREHDRRRFRGRNRLDARCRAHAGCVAVLVVVANVGRAFEGTFRARS
jgi:hypothetical protein